MTVATVPDLVGVARGSGWQGPVGPAPVRVLRGVSGAAVVAAFAVPVDRPGVGWVIGVGGIVAAVGMLGRGSQRPPALGRWLWGGMAVALAGVGAVRAAEWLFVLCVLGAGVAGALALTEGRSVLGVVAGPVSAMEAVVRGLPWVGRGVAALRGGAGSRARGLAVSVGVTVGLVVVFGALFAGADAVFASVVDAVVPRVDAGSVSWWVVVFAGAAVVTVGAVYLVVAPPPEVDGPAPARRSVRLVEWALPVGVLVVLFGLFVVVQLAVLFGGREYMLRTSGLTAADYARGGFWQLCVVTVLAQVVIAVAVRKAPRRTRGERGWLRGLLGGLTVLTLVIVASALSRMWAYQESYGYTLLRVLVAAFELWFGVVLLMVLAAGVRLRAEWLPRAVVGSALGALLVLAVVNPDAYVAERNVDRYERTGKIDVEYLGGLAVDAAPELARLPEPERSCALRAMRGRLAAYGRDGWQGWNLGRSVAHGVLDGAYLRTDLTGCPQNK